jgi:hypothetical protein
MNNKQFCLFLIYALSLIIKGINSASNISFFNDNLNMRNDSINSTEAKNIYSNDIAELALWMIILLIIVPVILVISLFYMCCKFICNWGRPGDIYHHHEFARPIILQQPSSSNYNA